MKGVIKANDVKICYSGHFKQRLIQMVRLFLLMKDKFISAEIGGIKIQVWQNKKSIFKGLT